MNMNMNVIRIWSCSRAKSEFDTFRQDIPNLRLRESRTVLEVVDVLETQNMIDDDPSRRCIVDSIEFGFELANRL